MITTIAITWAHICLSLMLLLWLALVAWPYPPETGFYPIGGAIRMVFRAVVGIIVSLVIWLVYFAVLR